ncbi:MAG: DUF4177 domain-containing protein [Lachnospiraceae bacterium]
MLKYEYVTIERENGAMAVQAVFTKHREIIDEYAKKGYGYVGYIPTKIHANGKIIDIDLIFEKQE